MRMVTDEDQEGVDVGLAASHVARSADAPTRERIPPPFTFLPHRPTMSSQMNKQDYVPDTMGELPVVRTASIELTSATQSPMKSRDAPMAILLANELFQLVPASSRVRQTSGETGNRADLLTLVEPLRASSNSTRSSNGSIVYHRSKTCSKVTRKNCLWKATMQSCDRRRSI